MLENISYNTEQGVKVSKLKTVKTISNKTPTQANNSNINQEERAERAFKHIVRGLVNQEFSLEQIKHIIHYNNIYIKGHEISKSTILVAMSSVLSEKKDSGLGITDEVFSFIQETEGEFTLRDVVEMTSIENDRGGKNKASAIMGRFVKDGTVKRVGKKNGVFQKIDNELEIMDFINAPDNECDIWLPFGLSDMVSIYPGNIIVLMGEPNAGKTALCLNLIRYNMDKWKIRYLNSEMMGTELKKRLLHFDDIPLTDWKFEPIPRSFDFEDALLTGEGNINIIDYLEITEDFYKVGKYINDIYRKLDGALAVICLQKDRGKDLGRGGIATLEKPRLALSIKSGEVKITKAKSWKGHDNPNGKTVNYKLAAGCWFKQCGEWK